MTINPQHKIPQTGEHMSLQAYFRLDYTVPSEKYEYHNGAIRLMSGGSVEHSIIAGNLYMELRLQFRSGSCVVHGSDMRVQVTQSSYFFPDVSVSCDVYDRRHRGIKTLLSPRLVIEVLSPSTEKIDRTEKLRTYQSCPSIAEIALVDQFTPYVEIWRRDQEDEESWHYVHYKRDDVVEFASLDVYISMDDIYRDVNFDEPLLEE